MAINLSNLPSGSSSSDRYRLVVAATGAPSGKEVAAEMVLLDTQGNAVWRGTMNSGGKRNFLPGLTSDLGRGVTAEYPIGWDRISTNRTDALGREGMSYSNGAAGYFIPLNNAKNMGELGGAGRYAFGIHPNGIDDTTSGCLAFVDANGDLNSSSDKSARTFYQAMMNIPADKRPKALEVINPKTVRSGAASAAVDRAKTETPPAKDDTNARDTRNTQRDGDLAGTVMAMCKALFGAFLPEWLVELIFGDNSNDLNESERDNTEISHSERVSNANSIRDANAIPKWKEFQAENKGVKVTHQNPVRGDVTVTSGMGARNVKGGSRNHKGLDMIGGSDILASADGIVLFAGKASGYGNLVVIGHADGTETRYGHMTGAQMPKVGARVAQGDQIGVMGSTGNSTGVHLHYEQRVNGVARNPIINGQVLAKGDDIDRHDHGGVRAQTETKEPSKMQALAAALDAGHEDKPTPNVPKMSKIARIAAGSAYRG